MGFLHIISSLWFWWLLQWLDMDEWLAKADGMNRLDLHGKVGKMFYDSTWITGEDYTYDFYEDIYQDPEYEYIEQQDIDLETNDEITKGEEESLEART